MQAYALLYYLRARQHDVEVIDYRCRMIEAQYHIFNPTILLLRKNVFLSLREYVSRYFTLRSRLQRRRKFEEFRKAYLLCCRTHKGQTTLMDYDAVITGSDQVWNFYLCRGSEQMYLLDVPLPAHTKRIAYAASSEMNGFNRLSGEYLRHCFANFNKISVREDFLANKIEALTGRSVSVCLDPTFLLDGDAYRRIATHPKSGHYILVFHMTDMSAYIPFIQDIARKKHLQVMEVYGGFHPASADDKKSDWGPLEMLGYINDADMVFTTSFHVLALSLILRKEVWVMDKGENQRQRNLLQMAGLTHRMLKSISDYDDSAIDYNSVEQELSPNVEQSKAFLNTI